MEGATLTLRELSPERAETFCEERRRGCAVSMVRGRAGMSRDSLPMVERFFRRVRVSRDEVEEEVRGAVMERARAISTGAIEVIESGSVDERLRRWVEFDLF